VSRGTATSAKAGNAKARRSVTVMATRHHTLAVIARLDRAIQYSRDADEIR
jgi:hypothetical protein